MPNILVLGGTTEASALARLLAQGGWNATLSYAGRTASPRQQPVPVRVGGFGGVEGLARHLRENAVTHLVDATHPFAAQMSANAMAAARQAGVPLLALTRPGWSAQAKDRWRRVTDIPAAVAALAGPPRRVMLALGRMHVPAFAAQPQHRYLLRFVDAPDSPPPLPNHALVIDRGPFTLEGDTRLLEQHRIETVVCKDAGGPGAEAKLAAARALGLEVLMINRPPPPPGRAEVHDPQAVLRWLDGALAHAATSPGTERGV